ncbi:MAG: DUF2459 domain-containing protein, partial [Chromatiales bacterium]
MQHVESHARQFPKGALLLCIAIACCTCASPVRDQGPAYHGEAAAHVYVVAHGWHTGIVIRRADIPPGLLPEQRDFPEADFLEFGWGDRDFYQAPAFSLALAIKAALASTGAVLHVVGFKGPVTSRFPGSEIIELKPAAQGLHGLSEYIHQSLAREGHTALSPLGAGFYRHSRFYPARGAFSLSNTCNTWTARALQAAGYPVSPASTAERVMSQVRRLGQPI